MEAAVADKIRPFKGRPDAALKVPHPRVYRSVQCGRMGRVFPPRAGLCDGHRPQAGSAARV